MAQEKRPESDLEYQKRMGVGLYQDYTNYTKAGLYTDPEEVPKELRKAPSPPKPPSEAYEKTGKRKRVARKR
jgi:hypothetical protein